MRQDNDRTQRLDAMSVAVADSARQLAVAGDLTRAMLQLAIADALRKAARGDKLGRRLALLDARALRRAMRRRKAAGEAA
ncbi:MAG: hypothetical protein RLZZ187_2604 [Pseudomonadota bacterium]|jgi:hypothetical protein